MPANSARKYRAYPTPDQADRLIEWGHTCRTLWNIALEQRQFIWKQWHRPMRAFEQNVHLTVGRRDMDWLSDLPAQSAREVLQALDQAYVNWWNPIHLAGPPTFRKRITGARIPFPGQAIRVEKLNSRWAQVRLPKIGRVRFRLSRPLGGAVRNASVSLTPAGWHVAFGIEVDTTAPPPNGLPGVGVDFGVKIAAFLSDEVTGRIMAPTLSAGEQARSLALQRQKARQLQWAKRHNGGKYSRRLRRTIKKIAQLRARQRRRQLDFTHKLTTDLTKNHGWVAIENLNVQGMTTSAKGTVEAPGKNVRQKAGLNRAILDNIPGERRRQLEYKARKYGSEVRPVRAAYTSQRCSSCGVIDPKSRPKCGREFTCATCGHADHADRNAAINIYNLAEGQPAIQCASIRQRIARPRKVSRTRTALVDA